MTNGIKIKPLATPHRRLTERLLREVCGVGNTAMRAMAKEDQEEARVEDQHQEADCAGSTGPNSQDERGHPKRAGRCDSQEGQG